MGRVLHASKSGWFPLCIQSQLPPIEDIEARYSGAASSLGLMMAIYWRVREWEIQFSSETVGVIPTITATGTYGFDADTEEGLVCAPNFIEKSFSSNNPLFAEHSFTLLSIFNDLFYGITSLDNNETFRYAYNLIYYSADDGSEGGLVYSGHVGFGIEDTLSFSVADAGICELKITRRPGLGNHFATISILPKSYWSYGGLYDTTTGLPN